MGTPPLFIRMTCLLLSGFCLFTAPAGMLLAFTQGRWYIFSFEVVVLLASITGALTGLNKLKSGPAMSMLITGGVVAVGATLSEPTLVARVLQGGGGGGAPAQGFNIVPWVIARLIAGVALIGLAGLTVLVRRPGVSFPLLIKGVLLGLPVLAAGGAMLFPSFRALVQNLSMVQSALLVVLACFVFGTLVSLSGHCLIRAFEVGVRDGESAAT